MFLAGTGAVLLAAPLAAEAQEAGKVVRIGVLGDTSPPIETSYSGIDAFRQELRDLGYLEGPYVTIAINVTTHRVTFPSRCRVDLRSSSGPPIPLRLIVGYGFIEHGFAKLAKGLTPLSPSSRPSA
jgi:hypothetical protein